MENSVIEASYPLSFRQEDAKALGKQLKNRHSVSLVGMGRVGISNFLRFFLYHKDIKNTYISPEERHFFIPVDLVDLVEREIFAFWRLTFKRIVDAVEASDINTDVKKYTEDLFSESIQSQDLFMTIDSIRRVLKKLSEHSLPTIFFLRFDRIKDAINPEFLDNLEGLVDATGEKLSYVFTSSRSLDRLSPQVFTKPALAAFTHALYVSPAKKEDTEIIFNTYKNRYLLELDSVIKDSLFDIVDGHVQYLQLALTFLHEQKIPVQDKSSLFDLLAKDERISLQSEELWDTLDKEEQGILIKVIHGDQINEDDKQAGKYLWDTGFIVEKGKTRTLFNPLFEYFVKQRNQKPEAEKVSIELTKKENLLFNLLKEHTNEICEREKIVEYVWPEVEAFGVSDWAIDRLVARLRNKLKAQKSPFEIQTVKTRGYKLVTS